MSTCTVVIEAKSFTFQKKKAPQGEQTSITETELLLRDPSSFHILLFIGYSLTPSKPSIYPSVSGDARLKFKAKIVENLRDCYLSITK